jgi:hypothetical protein
VQLFLVDWSKSGCRATLWKINGLVHVRTEPLSAIVRVFWVGFGLDQRDKIPVIQPFQLVGRNRPKSSVTSFVTKGQDII